MADLVLTWYVDGDVSRTKVQLDGTRYLDADYAPEWVHMTARIHGIGGGTGIDINADGISIFETPPALPEYQTDKKWTTIPGNTLRGGSILTMDVDSINSIRPVRDFTVQVGLRKI